MSRGDHDPAANQICDLLTTLEPKNQNGERGRQPDRWRELAANFEKWCVSDPDRLNEADRSKVLDVIVSQLGRAGVAGQRTLLSYFLRLDSPGLPPSTRTRRIQDALDKGVEDLHMRAVLGLRLGIAQSKALELSESKRTLQWAMQSGQLDAEQAILTRAYIEISKALAGEDTAESIEIPPDLPALTRLSLLRVNNELLRTRDRLRDRSDLVDQLVEESRALGRLEPVVAALRARANHELERGHVEVALADLEEASEIYVDPNSWLATVVQLQLVMVLVAAAENDRAESLAHALSERIADENSTFFAWNEVFLGDLAALAGHWSVAKRRYQRAGRVLETGHVSTKCLLDLRLALVRASRDRLKSAIERIDAHRKELTEQEAGLWCDAARVIAGQQPQRPSFDPRDIKPESLFLRHWVTERVKAVVQVDWKGRWIRRDSVLRSVSEGGPLERILRGLAQASPNVSFSRAQLTALGWPDEDPSSSVSKNRVNVSLNRLRGMGLKGYLIADDGWRLSESVEVVK